MQWLIIGFLIIRTNYKIDTMFIRHGADMKWLKQIYYFRNSYVICLYYELFELKCVCYFIFDNSTEYFF